MPSPSLRPGSAGGGKTFGSADLIARDLIGQVKLPLARRGLLARHSQSIDVLLRSGSIVDPFAQQRTAVDHVDRDLAMSVFVGEVAPQRVLRIQQPDRLEGQRLETPRLEGAVIVAGSFGMNL